MKSLQTVLLEANTLGIDNLYEVLMDEFLSMTKDIEVITKEEYGVKIYTIQFNNIKKRASEIEDYLISLTHPALVNFDGSCDSTYSGSWIGRLKQNWYDTVVIFVDDAGSSKINIRLSVRSNDSWCDSVKKLCKKKYKINLS